MPFKFHRVIDDSTAKETQQGPQRLEVAEPRERQQQPSSSSSSSSSDELMAPSLQQSNAPVSPSASHAVAKRVGVKPNIVEQFALGSVSSGAATCLSAPVDLIKARLQLQQRAASTSAAARGATPAAEATATGTRPTAVSLASAGTEASAAARAGGDSVREDHAAVRTPLQQRRRHEYASRATAAAPADSRHASAAPRYRGMMHAGATIAREEGVLALWSGLGAAMWRALTYSGVRLGCYEPIRDMYSQILRSRRAGDTNADASIATVNAPLPVKLLAGMTSGAMGAMIGTPFEGTKVRFQSGKYAYSGTFDAIRCIAREDGVSGLWNGWQATVARAAMLTATQVGFYDGVKTQVVQWTPWDARDPRTFLSAAMLAGLFSTTMSSAFDVVKTTQQGASRRAYSGMTDCALKMLRREGPMAFFKGWLPSYLRLGPHTLVTLWVYETVRRALGFTAL